MELRQFLKNWYTFKMTQKRSYASNSILKSKINKILAAVLFSTVLLLVLEAYIVDMKKPQTKFIYHNDNNAFLANISYKFSINTPNCKIPELNPFDAETQNLIQPEKYTPCFDYPLLTYIRKVNNSVTLNVNQTLRKVYSFFPIFCCYGEVYRYSESSAPDDNLIFSDCTSFENSVQVFGSVVYVSCENIFFLEVYANVHAILNPRNVEKKKALNPKTTFSVLLVGIDSISKAHLERVMPKTHKYLEENEDFINMKGYTKIGLNTLPNLMGILSGLNLDQVKRSCRYVDHIDDCYNIWKTFRKIGYVTAYGEDAVSIGSFNCCGKKGFDLPPTDFYFRPYMLAAEELGVIERHNMNYCAGPETEAERIMNLVRDFQISFKNVPKFGLFWMNTFSHDNAEMPAAMDGKVEEFLRDLSKNLEKTLFIFFSDHGIRFGALRETYSGFLEERIPFFYIRLPESFKQDYPKWYNSIKINTKRLITAYDIYMTLQDILVLTNKTYYVNQSLACPLCHSLFKEVSIERTCEDAAVPNQWCVCNASSYVTLKEPLKTQVAQFFVGEINKLVQSYPESYKCYIYKLEKVLFAGVSQAKKLLLKIETHPNAIFEGLFEMSPQLHLVGTINRLDKYSPHSRCIKKLSLERYCYCKESVFALLKTKFCNYLNC